MRRIMILSVVIYFAAIFIAYSAEPATEPQSGTKQNLKSEASAPALDAMKKKEIVEDLAAKLTSDYAIAETGSKMAAALRAKLKLNVYDKVTSAQEFAYILTQDLIAVSHDKHLNVSFINESLPALSDGPPSEEIIKSMLIKMNGAITEVKILDGNMGYMQINGVPTFEASKDAISAAFAFLRNTDALILDNRSNGGGDPKTVAWYMSYLSAGKPYIVNTFHHRKDNRIEEFWTTDIGDLSYGTRKPVFVLTSQSTFSGGEELTYDIQTFKRGVIVGAVTGGGANPTTLVQLVHNFQASIPYGYAVNPITKTNWEGVGVKPDVEVQPEQALIEARLLAVKRLLADEKDPFARISLNAISLRLELEKSKAQGDESELKEAQIIGTYTTSMLPDMPFTILARDGNLYVSLPGYPDVKLVHVGRNRYKPEGQPDGFFNTFSVEDGKIRLLAEQPNGAPISLEKK